MHNIVSWDQFCQVIPHCWINFKEKTFTCPASKYNVTKAIKKKINPGNDWKVYNYHKILGPYDSYEKAREAEKSYIDISTSDDIQLAALNKVRTLPTKRLITPKTFYGDSDIDTHSNASASKKFKIIEHPPSTYKVLENRAINVKIQKKRNSESVPNPESNIKHKKTLYLGRNNSFSNNPPSLKRHPFSIKIFHENSEDEETDINSNALDYNPESDNDKENEGFDYDNNHEGIHNNENEGFDYDNEKIDNEENEDLNREAEVNGLPIEMNIEDVHTTLRSLYEKVNILHEDFQQYKTEMRHEASRNKRKMEEIFTILREKFPINEGNEEITIDLMPDFPLTSVDEYTQFNETLRNDETIRKCFYKKIKYIGGDSVQKMISNILTYCITFEVGHKLSWTGAKNTVAIENSTFANTIIGAVTHTKEKTPDCTIALIVKHIKNWLQHAGDKMRYRIRKVQQERERRNENEYKYI